MSPDVERKLVRRARSGSLDAFDELMRTHQDRLFRFLLVNGACAADAEDIVQETFLAAWRYLDGYRERWRFSTWLYTIARRQAFGRRLDHARLPEALVDPAEGPDEAALTGQRRDNIWRVARELLPSDWFGVLWLYYAEDRKIGEIARILGRTVPWVKVTLHRSRKRLAGRIDAADWLPEEVVTNE
ncbi:MAG: sigma-70 family RNA polymerase sigma factor [Gammaproteobacteria bacterium]|jgi:RNA polymerase sigma-70 factor (ECF subfamily)|nr:sigma-70 family RNA polymerase sigma factor [Gammaproteobacteria bacterium]